MNVVISDIYHVMQLIHDDGRIDTKLLSSSNDINHELLTVMHGNNYSDRILIQDQEVYLELPDEVRNKITYKDLLINLSRVGLSQFDCNESDGPHGLFEYRAKLDTSDIVSIDLDEDIKEVQFFKYNNQGGFELIKKLELQVGARKLMILINSPSKSINTLNQQIHDNMQDPHLDSENIYLSQSDFAEYQNIDRIIDDDFMNIQCNVRLSDPNADRDILSNIGDSEYFHVIHNQEVKDSGEIQDKFIFCINFESIKKYDI